MPDVVVGLGNPGPAYRDTRHNVGQRVVERLAARLRRRFRREGGALVARGEWRGAPVVLVLPQAFMNVSGPVVAEALARSDADASDLVLVYDDIDLPLGTVRVRMKGGPGGHHGVESVLAALGTEAVRRVKVGIGRPDRKEAVPDHVLAPFAPEELPLVEAAVETAVERVLGLIQARRPGSQRPG